METLKLTICHYLNCESHIHLGMLRKTNAKSEQRFTTAQMRIRMRNVGGAMDVFTRSVLSIPSGKILDKNCESLYWWQTFR